MSAGEEGYLQGKKAEREGGREEKCKSWRELE